MYEDGGFDEDRMRSLQVRESDVMATARQRGLMWLDQVRYAVGAGREGF